VAWLLLPEAYPAGRTWLLREALSRLEAKLDPGLFTRIHRGKLINLSCIRAVHAAGHGDFSLVFPVRRKNGQPCASVLDVRCCREGGLRKSGVSAQFTNLGHTTTMSSEIAAVKRSRAFQADGRSIQSTYFRVFAIRRLRFCSGNRAGEFWP
jgi:hypothetical protein